MRDKLCAFCKKNPTSILLTPKSIGACDKCYDKIVVRVPKWDEKTTLTYIREAIKSKR